MIDNTVDIVEAFVSKLTFTIELVSALDNGDGSYQLCLVAQNPQKTEDPIYWLRPLSKITINAVIYTVQSLDDCDKITVSGASGPSKGDTFIIPAPFYFHGTPIAQGEKMNQIKKQSNKLPMVYLVEITREVFDRDVESAIERNSDVIMYFLDTANFKDWDTDAHYLKSINPMRNLVENFILLLEREGRIGLLDDFTLINHAKFGVFTVDKGHVTNLFNDELSGVELNVTLPIKEVLNCNNLC
jgi:hypothetical protein